MLTFNQRRGSNQWNHCCCVLLEWKPADAYTALDGTWLNTAAMLVLGCSWASWAVCPLFDMSPGKVTQWPLGPSGTSSLRNNSAMTSGNLPSLQRVWGHVFQTLRMFSCCCPSQHTVSTLLCSYENTARQTEAYPVPSSEQWKKTCHWYCTGWSLMRQNGCNV